MAPHPGGPAAPGSAAPGWEALKAEVDALPPEARDENASICHLLLTLGRNMEREAIGLPPLPYMSRRRHLSVAPDEP